MISTTKRLLINEWITSTDDALREMSFNDSAVETIFEFLDNPETDLEVSVKSVLNIESNFFCFISY